MPNVPRRTPSRGEHWALQWLRERKAENEAADLVPAENRIIDRLLAAPSQLHGVCKDIDEQVTAPKHRAHVLDVVVGALFPIETREYANAREARDEAERLDDAIAGKLGELVGLLDQRAQLSDDHAVSQNMPHIVEAIDGAYDRCDDRTRSLGRWHVMPELRRMRGQFDLKYWPPSAAVFEALADAHRQEAEPSDPTITEAIEGYSKPALEAVRLVLARLDTLAHPINLPPDEGRPPQLTPVVQFRDRSVADLLAAMGYEASEDHVKKVRQRR